MSDENRTEAVLTTTGEVLVKQADGSFRKVEGKTDWKRLKTMDDEVLRRLAAKGYGPSGERFN
jgi:hypothetical protein